MKKFHHPVITSGNMTKKCRKVFIFKREKIPSRFRTLNYGLAAKGFNVTVLSPDKDVSTTNLHYIHMEQVYEVLYNDNETEEINFVDMGQQSAYAMVNEFAFFSIVMCEGQVTSKGWKELENYPNDFKVC